MSAPSRVEGIRARLQSRAEEGCEGEWDESCWQKRRHTPDDWCDPCLAQEAAKEIDALRQSLQRSDANQAQLVKAEDAYRASERAMLRRLSDLLTGGNAGTWDEIAHAAEQAESRLAALQSSHAALLEALKAARDALVAFQNEAGFDKTQQGYHATMTDGELKLARAVASLDSIITREAALQAETPRS